MKAWEMVYYINASWQKCLRGEPIQSSLRTCCGVMGSQCLETRKKAADMILHQDDLSNELVEHAARLLNLKIKYQARLI